MFAHKTTTELHAAIEAAIHAGQRLDLSAVPDGALTLELAMRHGVALIASAVEEDRRQIASLDWHSRARIAGVSTELGRAKAAVLRLVPAESRAELAKILFASAERGRR